MPQRAERAKLWAATHSDLVDILFIDNYAVISSVVEITTNLFILNC